MSDLYFEAAKSLEDHAVRNPYKGPSLAGDQFAGWPVSALLDIIPATERVKVAQAFYNLNAGVFRGGSPPAHTHSVGGASGGGTYSQAAGQTVRTHSLEEMMAMRMRWGQGAMQPVGFAHMAMHLAGDVVHVWIVTHDGKDVVLEDEYGLYPSDGLVTKIRLLQQEKQT